jgi:putative serine protease PepD
VLVVVAVAAGLLGGIVGAGGVALTDSSDAPGTSNTLTAPAATGPSPAPAAVPDGSIAQVAQSVLPSVVSITVQTGQGVGSGSGIVLSSDGQVLTNNHVVAGASTGRITVTFNDGQRAAAQVLGRDPVTDLAVLATQDVSGATPARLGVSSSLVVGQEVIAVGSPLGLAGTVTSGIVSALQRPIQPGAASGADRATVIDAIQTDAAIIAGNSGGPLIDMAGRVVGINSAIASLGPSIGAQSGSIGVGFAIPIDQARPIARQLAEQGRATHALLGVSVDNAVDAGLPAGAAVISVSPGSAADEAGLRPGDVITAIDDRQIDSADALVAAVRSHRPGDTVTVTWQRGPLNRQQQADVTLGSDAEQ